MWWPFFVECWCDVAPIGATSHQHWLGHVEAPGDGRHSLVHAVDAEHRRLDAVLPRRELLVDLALPRREGHLVELGPSLQLVLRDGDAVHDEVGVVANREVDLDLRLRQHRATRRGASSSTTLGEPAI